MKTSVALALAAFAAQGVFSQVALLQQCGGKAYTGQTTCVAGATCKVVSEWYSQCVSSTGAGGNQTPTTPSQPKMEWVYAELNPATCSVPSTSLTTIQKLPDPFKSISGSRITSKSDWICRRKEIYKQIQDYELGTKPEKPSSVSGSVSGNRLNINVSEGGKSISFSVTINKPGGNGPFPAIIAYGAASIPVPSGVATINFNNDDIAAQQNTGSRGRGKFYDLYGSSHSAGALTAWAWGVSRIIDALESTPSAGIDPKRIGVTGCSRNGKGALVAGAFDERVALTLPQESGSGGSACWRLSDGQKASGTNVQTASQIITENVWMGKSFEQYVNSVTRLPFDHHMLIGLVAPRGIFIIENSSMEWLGAMSTYGCSKAGSLIYEGLGVSGAYGYSTVGGHNHCQFPGSQGSDLNAFVDRYLKGGNSDPGPMVKADNNGGFRDADWIDWTVPSLS